VAWWTRKYSATSRTVSSVQSQYRNWSDFSFLLLLAVFCIFEPRTKAKPSYEKQINGISFEKAVKLSGNSKCEIPLTGTHTIGFPVYDDSRFAPEQPKQARNMPSEEILSILRAYNTPGVKLSAVGYGTFNFFLDSPNFVRSTPTLS
jgi:hypothetical protein